MSGIFLIKHLLTKTPQFMESNPQSDGSLPIEAPKPKSNLKVKKEERKEEHKEEEVYFDCKTLDKFGGEKFDKVVEKPV